MKKNILLVFLALVMVTCLALTACTLPLPDDDDKGWGEVFTLETAYAEAQSLGYTGSLTDFLDSIRGKDGQNGEPGADGIGIKSVTVNSEGKLIVTLSNDIVIDCGSVKGEQGPAGPQGPAGENGTDGITPQLKIGEDNYWYVSYDNGATWESLGVKATGESFSQQEHNWKKLYTLKEADCVNEGIDIYACEECNILRYFTVESLGGQHNYETTVIAPCTEQGYTLHKCSICQDEYKDTFVEPTGQHNFHEYDQCPNCGVVLADIAVDVIDMSATSNDNVTCYVTANEDDTYNAYIKGTGAIKNYTLALGSSVDTEESNQQNISPFFDKYAIKNAYIQEGITHIGDCLFVYAPDGDMFANKLQYVSIPQSVTSIGGYAFAYCVNLPSVVLPNTLTTIREGAFGVCLSLTSIEIPASVTSIGEVAFYGCYQLVEVVNKSTHFTVTKESDENGYVGYYALAVYNVGDSYETHLSNDSGYMVYTDNDQKILVGYVGEETDLVIPSYVTSINNGAFCERNDITSIIIPDNVTSIGDMSFYNCRNLSSVTIGNGVTEIGYSAFCYCYNLSSVSIGNGLSYIGDNMFSHCTSLTSITIPNSVTSIGGSAFHDCSSLISITIPDSVTFIGYGAFRDCSSLTSITIPQSVTYIGGYAVYNCDSLQSIVFEDPTNWYYGSFSASNKVDVSYSTDNVYYYNRYYASEPMLKHTEHVWDSDGICAICGALCEHEFDANGLCAACGYQCAHEKWAEATCTKCGKVCSEHAWDASKEACRICGTPCTHKYAEVEGEFICSVCGNKCEHAAWTDAVCDKCGRECTAHEWDGKIEGCAICGTPCDHEFSDTGLCAICKNQCEHAYWTLGICDKCEMACAHAEYSYGICKVCGINMGQKGKDACTHDYKNGLCTICGSADPAAAATSKTYNLSASSLPTMWNSLDYQTNDATKVTGYTEDGFYTFDYNEDKTGYKMVPAMALDFPVEMPITDELAAKWGFEADKDGNYPQHHIWKVELRHDLKYDNGDVITAESYIQTAIRLLDPKAANYRADSLYSGNLVIHNAEGYLKQGSTQWVDVTKGKGIGYGDVAAWKDATADQLAAITFKTEGSYVVNYFQSKNPGYDGSFLLSYFAGISEDAVKSLDGMTAAEILADKDKSAILDALFAMWCTDEGEEFGFFTSPVTYPQVNWSEVGLYAEDTYTLVFVLDKPLEGFYLHYSIGLPLVHVPTYDACASEEGGVYTNKYGTSVETYVGHGPYKLVTHVADSILQFTKNPYWYGHNEDNQFDDTVYEATGIVIKQVVDGATRLQMFLKGELDNYGLQEAYMEDYQSSKYTYYTEGDSTWFVALNPNFDALQQKEKEAEPINYGYIVNKTVLTIKEFRQALSFSLNRAEYQLTLDPVGSVGKALYSGMIISDPENGVTYRSTEQAKDTILAFWGLTNDVCPADCTCGGLEHAYATKDEAIDSITGYDPTGAKALFDAAYELAVEEKLIPADALESGKWEVQILVGQPGTGSSTYYNKGYEYLSKIWTEAVKGTKFEGHLTFKQSAPLGSSNFSEYLKNNQIDLLFGVGWTGSALDPYSLIEAYVAPSYQYDPGWDTSATQMIVELPMKDGKYDETGDIVRLEGSVYDWHETLSGEVMTMVVVDAEGNPVKDDKGEELIVEIAAGTSANATMRLIILAKIEQAVLEQYDMIPVGLDASASMKCHRLQFETEEYVYGVGRGGLKYLDFTMTDAEWAAAVKAAGGEWNYKASDAE